MRLGLVASLAGPGGNLTGTNLLTGEVLAENGSSSCASWCREWLVLLCSSIQPNFVPGYRGHGKRRRTGSPDAMGLQGLILNASTSREIDAAFATIARERLDAYFVSPHRRSSPAGACN